MHPRSGFHLENLTTEECDKQRHVTLQAALTRDWAGTRLSRIGALIVPTGKNELPAGNFKFLTG